MTVTGSVGDKPLGPARLRARQGGSFRTPVSVLGQGLVQRLQSGARGAGDDMRRAPDGRGQAAPYLKQA